MLSQTMQNLRLKIITLVAINVFQPVKKSSLVEQLDTVIDINQMDHILSELVEEKRVVIEKDHLRLTYKGMKSLIPVKGRILRDIQRMKYLVQISKQRGGS